MPIQSEFNPRLGKLVGEYSNVVGRFGPDSAEAKAVRAARAGDREFLDYADALDQVKRNLGGTGMAASGGPKVVIKTTITADGWTTRITMPDGDTFRRSMRREGSGAFVGTRDGSFEDDGLPECIIEAAENSELMEVAQYLDGQRED